MKTISYEQYLSTNNDNYVDAENPADCSTRLKNDNVEIMVHKSINKDDNPDHFFTGEDEDVCIVLKGDAIEIVYDCTWGEIEKVYS